MYTTSTNVFQIYLVFWIRFDFLEFQQIILCFFPLFNWPSYVLINVKGVVTIKWAKKASDGEKNNSKLEK